MVSLIEEVRDVDLGDVRLDSRLGKVIEELGATPNLSIPAATIARAETPSTNDQSNWLYKVRASDCLYKCMSTAQNAFGPDS